MKQYSRDEIVELCQRLEEELACHEWMHGDWRVWPYLRSRLLLALISGHAAPVYTDRKSMWKNRIRAACKTVGMPLLCTKRRRLARSAGAPFYCNEKLKVGQICDVALVDQGPFGSIGEGCAEVSSYTYVLEQFESHGLKPVHLPHSRVPASLDALERPAATLKRCHWTRMEVRTKQVDWYQDYLSLAKRIYRERGIPLRKDILHELAVIERVSHLYEAFFVEHVIRFLAVVCYYNGDAMAALLAAARLGIPSFDIQHGKHDIAHPMYAKWICQPSGRYETMPDYFWCWGERDVQVHEQFNPGLSRYVQAFAGGQGDIYRNAQKVEIWNPACYKKVKAFCRQKELRIAFLCTGLSAPQKPLMAAAVASAPHSWLWFHREHPRLMRSDMYPDLKARFKEMGANDHVLFEEADTLTLFELFSFCDVIVSDWSTCAQEALAFGIPAVIIHPNGYDAYQQAIKAGVMIYAGQDAGSLVSAIRQAATIQASDCQYYATYYYATGVHADKAFKEVLKEIKG